MVLAIKVGRPRSPWHVFWLSAATFGVYWFYWAYRSQDEVYRQFELGREGRDEGVVWLLFGNFLPFLRYIYYYRFVANIRYLRLRFGFPDSLSPGGFLGLSLTAGAVFTVLAIVGLSLIGAAIEVFFDEVEVVDDGLFTGGLLFIAIAVAQWVVLKGLAMRALQRDINEVWTAYDARAAHVRAAAQAFPGPSLAAAPPRTATAGAGAVGGPPAPAMGAPPR